MSAEPPEGAPLPAPPDQRLWEEAAAKAALGQLDAVRAAAEKWTGTVTALLGIFGTVAVVGGGGDIVDVPADQRGTVAVLVAVAGVGALVSIVTGALAAQGIRFSRHGNWNGDALRATVTERAPTAAALLNVSRASGIIAAVLVFVVGFLPLAASAEPGEERGATVLVVTTDGALRCGELGADAAGAVTLGGASLDGVAQVHVVDAC